MEQACTFYFPFGCSSLLLNSLVKSSEITIFIRTFLFMDLIFLLFWLYYNVARN